MDKLIILLINKYGYIGIFILIMLENLFPPIPSEIVLGFSGYMTKVTHLTIFKIVLISAVASSTGALILYFIGFFLGEKYLTNFSKTSLGHFFGLKENTFFKTNDWFRKYGSLSIFFGRFFPLIRCLISIPAGINQTSITKFLTLTFIANFIWNGLLTLLGYYLGNNWYKIVTYLRQYILLIIAVLVIILLVFIILYVINYLKKKIYN